MRVCMSNHIFMLVYDELNIFQCKIYVDASAVDHFIYTIYYIVSVVNYFHFFTLCKVSYFTNIRFHLKNSYSIITTNGFFYVRGSCPSK